jgi:hypothetical protein
LTDLRSPSFSSFQTSAGIIPIPDLEASANSSKTHASEEEDARSSSNAAAASPGAPASSSSVAQQAPATGPVSGLSEYERKYGVILQYFSPAEVDLSGVRGNVVQVS